VLKSLLKETEDLEMKIHDLILVMDELHNDTESEKDADLNQILKTQLDSMEQYRQCLLKRISKFVDK
jgi:hypothetical protein